MAPRDPDDYSDFDNVMDHDSDQDEYEDEDEDAIDVDDPEDEDDEEAGYVAQPVKNPTLSNK
ncbi:hypothetical protein HDU99_008545, partial [Rhizoclosmatium hyalinum]